MVCPPLHHSSTVRHPLRSVVSASHFISFYVRKLAFDPISVEQVGFVQDRGSDGAETVRRGAAVISHPVDGIEHGVAGHAVAFSRRREDVGTATRKRAQLAQYCDGLA